MAEPSPQFTPAPMLLRDVAVGEAAEVWFGGSAYRVTFQQAQAGASSNASLVLAYFRMERLSGPGGFVPVAYLALESALDLENVSFEGIGQPLLFAEELLSAYDSAGFVAFEANASVSRYALYLNASDADANVTQWLRFPVQVDVLASETVPDAVFDGPSLVLSSADFEGSRAFFLAASGPLEPLPGANRSGYSAWFRSKDGTSALQQAWPVAAGSTQAFLSVKARLESEPGAESLDAPDVGGQSVLVRLGSPLTPAFSLAFVRNGILEELSIEGPGADADFLVALAQTADAKIR
ncbi:MAG: hypothetical protein Q8P02_00695 [Candidatus Micrarchaeota archaeon]|nr:hypothetical protein [Candidatus Micrarchaeota archaeon]